MSNSKYTKTKKKLLKLTAKQLPGAGMRVKLLRMCGYVIGEQVYIGEDFIIVDDLGDSQFNLCIGDRASVAPRVTFVLHTQPNESRIAPYVNSHRGRHHPGVGCVDWDWLSHPAERDDRRGGRGRRQLGGHEERAALYGRRRCPAKKIKDVIVPWNTTQA